MDNIILTGFMGCGKTTVGIRLSYRTRRSLEDTDKMIERREKRSIQEIFDTDGEEAFRRMETECLEELLNGREASIISAGGGLAVQPRNVPLLHRLGTVVYLKASPELVCERLQNDAARPLLRTADPEKRIRELMAVRLPFYEKAADLTVEVDGLTAEEVAQEILERIGWREEEQPE